MIKILFAGDYCPTSRVKKLIELEKLNEIFNEITPLTENADYSIVNLECPVVTNEVKPIDKYGPHLRTSPKAIKAIRNSGFDMVTLANNHFYDCGDSGVEETFEACDKFGVATVGGGRNLEESKIISYQEIKGKRFAIINFCEHEFSIATETKGGSNPLNPISNYYQIQEARNQSDFVIIIVHGGHEHYQLPSPRMKETYRFFVDAGADVVVNHHQHCFSGYEIYNKKPIFYGLGNFCFDSNDKRNSTWNEGFLAEIEFENDNISFNLHPFTQGNIKSGIVLMKNEKKVQFEKKITQLNEIIINNDLLHKAVNEYYLVEGKKLFAIFEPYTNRYLHGLFRRNFIPSLISKKKLLGIRNFMQCEAHNDKLVSYLKSLKYYE